MPDQSGYAVGWGALALINAGLAQGKGRSGLFWFVISLLLGPLATLLIVVLPMPGVEARTLGRSEWVVVGAVVAVFVVLVVGLMAAGIPARVTGG
jgi:phosphatidylserine synthase